MSKITRCIADFAEKAEQELQATVGPKKLLLEKSRGYYLEELLFTTLVIAVKHYESKPHKFNRSQLQIIAAINKELLARQNPANTFKLHVETITQIAKLVKKLDKPTGAKGYLWEIINWGNNSEFYQVIIGILVRFPINKIMYLQLKENNKEQILQSMVTRLTQAMERNRLELAFVRQTIARSKVEAEVKVNSPQSVDFDSVLQTGDANRIQQSLVKLTFCYAQLTAEQFDIKAFDNQHRTWLHWAAKVNNAVAIQILIDRNAEVNALDKTGCTPLHYAVQANAYEAVEALLTRKALLGIKSANGYTPLELANSDNKVDQRVITLLSQAARSSEQCSSSTDAKESIMKTKSTLTMS